jgi:hypothetical protein
LSTARRLSSSFATVPGSFATLTARESYRRPDDACIQNTILHGAHRLGHHEVNDG